MPCRCLITLCTCRLILILNLLRLQQIAPSPLSLCTWVLHGGFSSFKPLQCPRQQHSALVRGYDSSGRSRASLWRSFPSLVYSCRPRPTAWQLLRRLQVERSSGPAHFPTASALSGLIFNSLKQKKELAAWFLLTFSSYGNYSSKIKHSQEEKGNFRRSSLHSFSK